MSTVLHFSYQCPYCGFSFSQIQELSDLLLDVPEICQCPDHSGGCGQHFAVYHRIGTHTDCCEILAPDSVKAEATR